VPTVAALRGAVAGGGLGLALACDVRVASDTVRMSTAYARIGLPGDWGVTLLLPDLIGRHQASRLLRQATRLKSTECGALGLVDELVDDDTLDQRAMDVAGELAAGPTAAYAETKRLLMLPGLRDHLAQEIEATLRVQETADHNEGLTSLLEHRSPTFHGS